MMNKKLLALAVAAAVMPVAALASGPTLYGQIDVSLESDDNGTTDQFNLVNNSSRLGVRGEAETSVSDLKGIYQAEYGIDATDGTLFTQRDIFVGLKGGFGTLRLGSMDTPLKSIQGGVDQFNDTSVDMGNHVAGEQRNGNTIYYTSPAIADAVTIHVAVIPGETVADNGVADFTSLAVSYDTDSLHLAIATTDTVVSGSGGTADLVSTDDIDAVRAVATYTTDTFMVGLLYQTAEDSAVSGNEDTSMVLSGAFMTGDWKFKAQYGMTEGDAGGNEITMFGLGADYALGKSTTAYAFFATEEDDAALDRQVISVGLKQKF